MAKLIVKNFSCIKHAELDIANFTIIIGEQASGKSLLSKLVYFSQRIPPNLEGLFEAEKTIKDLENDIIDNFLLWFPCGAWGAKTFSIYFEIGKFSLKIERPSVAKSKNEKIKIYFSQVFLDEYDKFLKYIKEENEKYSKIENKKGADIGYGLEPFYRIWRSEGAKFREKLDINRIHQTFVPAGRAYFTSIGRIVGFFEEIGSVDPITAGFGRLYAFLSDTKGVRFFPSRTRKLENVNSYHLNFEKRILRGEIKIEKDKRYILSDDGRKVPLAIASSGQQEVIPLLQVLGYTAEVKNRTFLFIEEPEAHLFPTAQSELIEYISSFVTDEKNSSKMFITTHSPYILAQVNNFIKAGILSQESNDATKKKIEKIIPKEAWLKYGYVIAYTIKDGVLESIMDAETGLINAEAIDGVSEVISEQFSKLLDIEFPDV